MAKKRIIVPRTRNNKTMTESMFWGWIRSSLRGRSMYWKPIAEAKKKSRRDAKGLGRIKYQYQCSECKGWFLDKEVFVDHIKEVGTLTCASDLPQFIENLFVEVEGLQVLCNKRLDGKVSCHKVKTDNYNKSQREKRILKKE